MTLGGTIIALARAMEIAKRLGIGCGSVYRLLGDVVT